MSPLRIWLRCEKKEFEHRAALSPTTAKALVDHGFIVSVERDDQRIFNDSEYEAVGCTLVEHNSWPTAPLDTIIIGLKELPLSEDPLPHTHIQFAHAYKNQAGWAAVLKRFHRGGGKLYDIEFLHGEDGRRVAAFGFHAGFAGAAAGALEIAGEKKGTALGRLDPYPNEQAMIADVKEQLGSSVRSIKVLVIGALGRCGRGAVDLFRKIGIQEDNILKWDLDETARGGPFQEIMDVDVFVNCIYLSFAIPPFVTRDQINAAGKGRKLRVIVDVSCDTTNPFNPIPVYNVNTTFRSPTVLVDKIHSENPPLSVISIDHLPTLLPRESSEQFSSDLLPCLLQLPEREKARVWVEAETLFNKKMREAVGN